MSGPRTRRPPTCPAFQSAPTASPSCLRIVLVRSGRTSAWDADEIGRVRHAVARDPRLPLPRNPLVLPPSFLTLEAGCSTTPKSASQYRTHPMTNAGRLT
eukprot:2406065-Rhodomonas_salina.5